MNWMTSGRKRLTKANKSRELRAVHFSSSAIKPGTLSRSHQQAQSSRQSADVSRLKFRWGLNAAKAGAPSVDDHLHQSHRSSHRAQQGHHHRPPSPFSGPLPIAACQVGQFILTCYHSSCCGLHQQQLSAPPSTRVIVSAVMCAGV